MPKFFFNLRDDVSVEDCEGKELADAGTAREAAVHYAREMMAEDVRDGRLVLKDSIEIVDEKGEKVLTVPFRDAIDIEE